ncbi:MAG: 2-amino-4-hydroxy-6-hydroxymethyldihydropteridine diphosphokinase [Acidocella sp. 20-57-95]|nr:MAG: 2-amino-4-hydroxy-6-hydroxymethyldihydropteridine diphosphokinase [Acidocella sp. 20-57-95]OYV58397.1 MAG: 2-amino-4-hydroxy-6-hydroxymethyldihydropteridine diphosphokinase [Acidocella sp. 21-58-7]HQT63678.1 2-amino-4-hydroxy-6-hydroxymethyldihydropteridine diphosphokinase [Acidocella sp.]HQU05232.1 2-amino-4-hydroxy-6-hydroxymethyldihydropteridine diphosphokinase [Acidocella sp.]
MILIAIGANLPGPGGETALQTCVRAVGELKTLSGLKFKSLSNWYRTAAVPASDQPDYCNGVARLEGDIGPADLLGQLQAIETKFGRERSVKDAARTLDIDIIDLNGTIRALPDPILPHPRAHLRAFVLRPILDVAPGWVHPTFRRSVTSLMVDLPAQAIQPWFDT